MLLPPRFRTESQVDRFYCSFEQSGDCWLWDGHINDKGYGVFCMNGRKESAHRAAWLLLRGPIHDGLHVLHRCDVRNCVNPDHLWLGTHRDNMRDMSAKGRGGTTRGESTPWAVLDEAKVRSILESAESGRALARKYGVSNSTVYAVRQGKTWKDIAR